MNIKPIAVLACMLVLTGCASVSKGRFSLIDLDLRSPEQISAGAVENTYIYGATNNVSELAKETPRSFPLEIIIKFLSIVKGRIRILSLEWKANEQE